MLPNFEQCVRALSEAIVRQERRAAANPRDILSVAEYLMETYSKMPDYLRIPFRGLTLLFDASSYVRYGKPFHRLPPDCRRRQMDFWATLPIRFAPSLIAFYRTFAAFGLSSDVYRQD
jgi:hypothetical protein